MKKVFIVSMVCVSLIGCAASFDKQRWLNNEKDRYEIAKSLSEKEDLCSYTPDQIIKQLGEPTRSYQVMGPVSDMEYLVLDKKTPDLHQKISLIIRTQENKTHSVRFEFNDTKLSSQGKNRVDSESVCDLSASFPDPILDY